MNRYLMAAAMFVAVAAETVVRVYASLETLRTTTTSFWLNPVPTA